MTYKIYKVTIGKDSSDVKIEYMLELEANNRIQAEEFCKGKEIRMEGFREVYFPVED